MKILSKLCHSFIIIWEYEIMDTLKNINILTKPNYSYLLKQISQLPDSLDIIGNMPPETHKYLCVVGSRSYSSYGKDACEQLIAGLSGYPIVIVSGLAFGIDSIAHEAALKAGLVTISFPGSGLGTDVLYPQKHINLAQRIVEAGGALLSPLKRNQEATIWTFPTRNRIMAGISHATLIIQADKKSGTLLTAGNALEFNRDVLVVPGSIYSPLSYGPHKLLRDGAIAITSSEQILEVLGFEMSDKNNDTDVSLSDDEKRILEKITEPIDRDSLIRKLELPAGFVNAILIELELKKIIAERQGVLMLN